ncbi:MAG: hypothetical protein E6248_12970 [Clostridium sp.]|uniref:hypothetical protein n=1 Tax=Clostridium sp. TaxID=1506 RepID=UPI0029100090|nr:hypothetical protein [Clostridium sp.]MDU5111351.1 hypothetical protein [Clostridium sp.]
MVSKKKRKVTRLEKIIITLGSIIILIIMIISLRGYLKDYKKSLVRDAARELVLAVEKAEINHEIEFAEDNTIVDIKLEADKDKILKEYIKDVSVLNKIEALSIEDARKIVDEEVKFEVSNEGKFIKIVE